MSAIIVTNNGFVIGGEHLEHSPKGTTWKDHKYIKKVNGRYVYESAKTVGNEKVTEQDVRVMSKDNLKKIKNAEEFGRKIISSVLKQTKEEYNLKKIEKVRQMGMRVLDNMLGSEYLGTTYASDKDYKMSDAYKNRKTGKAFWRKDWLYD